MKFSKIFSKWDRHNTAVFAVFLALVVATIAPTFASADQVTTRSIALSSSSADASGVTYQVKFTAVSAAAAFAIDFCSEGPLVGTTCTAPAGFNASAAASTTAGFTDTTGTTNRVVVADPITAAQNVSVDVTGIHNPTAAGPLYARIITYSNADTAASDTTETGTDDGGVAVDITNSVGVSGVVLETLTFCVENVAPTDNCANASDIHNAPVLKIGETTGSVVALDAGHISTGKIYTQVSTNAATGAVINLKSATDCGGMKRVGATVCDIPPLTTGALTAGDAGFGVMTGTTVSAGEDDGANGTIRPVPDSGYSNTAYRLNYVANNATGVTSTYGDPFLDTNGAPVNNKNMDITFGATVSNNTPAGTYSTDLSMVATGKF